MSTLPHESARRHAGFPDGPEKKSQDTAFLVDTKVASELLSIGARTLWTLTNRDAIPSRRIGRLVRYCPRELTAWVECGCPTEPGASERVRVALRNGAIR